MPIIANWTFRHNGTIYASGELIDGMSIDEEERYVNEGLAHRPIAVTVSISPNPSTLTPIDALHEVLKNESKRDLLVIAEHLEIGATEKQKIGEILGLIVADAEERGVDLESLSDVQLTRFAVLLGVEADGDREELMNSIDRHIKNNEL